MSLGAIDKDHLGIPGESTAILGMRVDPVSVHEAADLIIEWTREPASRVVCAANVHMIMEAYDHPDFQAMINAADLVLPDGTPTVWGLRLQGADIQSRVRVSPDFIFEVLARAELAGTPVGLYGGTNESLPEITSLLQTGFPGLSIRFAYAPPFRPLTPDEDTKVSSDIISSGAQLLLVGIGCPKQEKWMTAHRPALPCVMMGVGAAFDLFAGKTKDAPAWTHNTGLEWCYRLALEPRRLWQRHVRNDPRFLALLAEEQITKLRPRADAAPKATNVREDQAAQR